MRLPDQPPRPDRLVEAALSAWENEGGAPVLAALPAKRERSRSPRIRFLELPDVRRLRRRGQVPLLLAENSTGRSVEIAAEPSY